MQSGAGKAALIVIGLAVIGVGGYHIYKGASQKFLDDLKVSGGPVLTPIGMTGYIAKGTVLAGAGLLVIVATLRADPAKAAGCRRRGQDARPGAVRQAAADPCRRRLRRLRRVLPCAGPLRADVTSAEEPQAG